jgi:hypothetical protein
VLVLSSDSCCSVAGHTSSFCPLSEELNSFTSRWTTYVEEKVVNLAPSMSRQVILSMCHLSLTFDSHIICFSP